MKTMDIQKILNNANIRDIFNNFDIKKLLNFSKKAEQVLVVDIGSKLTLIDVGIKREINVNALKVVETRLIASLPEKNEIILKSLRDFITENNIQHKNAILKPYLNSVLIKRMQLPAVPHSELLDAIKWQLKEEVSFDLSKAVLGFAIIKESTKEDGAKVLDIMCALADEGEVANQVSLLKQSGLTCLSVGLSAFGYEKIAEKYLTQEKDKPIGVLHLTDEQCYITIYNNKKLEFYRELPISLDKLKESLRGVLVSDKGRIELQASEAEELLFSVGVPEEGSNYKDKLNFTQILSMLRPILERLAGEIKRSLTYYDSQFEGGDVAAIFVAGSALGIPNIDTFLGKELSLDVKKISLSDKIGVSSTIKLEDLLTKYASLGLAFDHTDNINLLPQEFRSEKIEKFEKVSLRWIAFIAFMLLIVSYLFAKWGVGAYQRRLNNAVLHLNVLSEVKEIKVKFDELDNFVVGVKNLELPTGMVLKKLSNIAPRELFLNSLSLNVNSKTGSMSGLVKSINKNPDAILTKFLRDMESSGYFTDANISSVEKSKEGGFDITRFSIAFKLP